MVYNCLNEIGEQVKVPPQNQLRQLFINSKLFFVENNNILFVSDFLSKRRKSSSFVVFVNSSGISKLKFKGFTGAFSLVQRARCIVLFILAKLGN
jgi:hypothetical protein